jgi:hypothetical protein
MIASRAEQFEDGRDRRKLVSRRAHGVMNFGLFATPERDVVFGLNDFDETLRGPWEWDVKRLAASLVVASQDVGFGRCTAEMVAVAGVRAYRHRTAEMSTMRPLEVWYDRIDLTELIKAAPDKATKACRKAMRRKARHRIADNLFPKLVDHEGGFLRLADQHPLLLHLDGVAPESVQGFFDAYRASVPGDRQVLFDRFVLRDGAIKVVGVAASAPVVTSCCSPTTTASRCCCKLRKRTIRCSPPTSDRAGVPLHNGERVGTGQQLMQPASDIFLGYSTSPAGRDFYVRQLRDMKLSVTLAADEDLMKRYAQFCGLALARAHANTGSAAETSGYLGKSGTFENSLGQFAVAYAEQTDRDHKMLVEAIDAGISLIKFDEFRHYRQSARDSAAFVATALAVFFVSVLAGVVAGVIIALLLLIVSTSESPTRQMALDRQHDVYVHLDHHPDAELIPGILVVGIYGPLFFADADTFRNSVLEFVESYDPHTVVVELSAVDGHGRRASADATHPGPARKARDRTPRERRQRAHRTHAQDRRDPRRWPAQHPSDRPRRLRERAVAYR